MIPRLITVFILCCSLLTSSVSYAAPIANGSLSILLTQHREIKTGVGGMEMVTKHGRALADATFKLMSDPKNRAYLNSADGIELRKHQQLLTNFLSVQDKFEKCIKDKDSKRKLDERVLQASFQNMTTLTDSVLPCMNEKYTVDKNFEEFNEKMTHTMKSMVRPYFQNQLTKQVMSNTAKALLGFKQKFRPDFMKDGKLAPKELKELADEVCIKKIPNARGGYLTQDVCSAMDKSFRPGLEKEIRAFSETPAIAQTKKITPEQATVSLNMSIMLMNNALAAIPVKKDKGFIYDSANLSDEKTKKEFDNYVSQYMNEISQGAGSLFLTKTIKDEAGGIKRLDSDDTTKNKQNVYQFTKHKNVKIDDVTKAINEAENKMKAQARDTLLVAAKSVSLKGQIKASEDDIKDLVKINPFAAGQMILREPEYTDILCDSINKVNQTDVNDENIDKYFAIGSAVLGGALILTGVGTIAGAYLVTGSLTAGVAAGTLGGTILGYSALAGTAFEVVNLGYSSNRAYNFWDESKRLEEAFLTQNSDRGAVLEAQVALTEFKDARLSAGISLASMGLNLIVAGKLFNILKTGTNKVSADELKAATKIIQYLSETKVAKALKDTAAMLGAAGVEKIDDFLLLLARAGEKNRIKFLELLKDGKLTPDKIKTIVEDALDAAKNCAKT